MRKHLFASALALICAAAPALAQSSEPGPPIPNVNLALVYDGREVAADTTDQDGYAEFPADRIGDHGVTLQSPSPVDAVLFATAGRDEWYVLLAPGIGPQPAIEIPVEAPGMVMVRLESLDPAYVPPEPDVEPVIIRPEAPIENVHEQE